jgi:predicted nucleic acid-binding protein
MDPRGPEPVALLVVDASVALRWVLNEPGHSQSLDLLDGFAAGRIRLISLDILLLEAASALSKGCRRKRLTRKAAHTALGKLQTFAPPLASAGDYAGAAFELSVANQLSFWDSLYLALAIDRRADLVTADRRMYASARKVYPYMRLLETS